MRWDKGLRPSQKGARKRRGHWIACLVAPPAILMFAVLACLQRYDIPSESMYPSLEQGDFIVASRWVYSDVTVLRDAATAVGLESVFGEPRRGDVIVFRYPGPNVAYRGSAWVKRVIGMPGETVRMRGGRLYIDDRSVDRREIGSEPRDWAPGGQVRRYVETLPEGQQHLILEVSDAQRFDNTPAMKVPAGHYLVLGDNRDNALDSRGEGVWFVSREQILGRAEMVTWSSRVCADLWEIWSWPHLRTDRFMKVIR